MRQHLACVNALAEICQAQVKGASIGSKAVEFIPSAIQAGEYRFAVGSAGSTTLVLQTVLPALLLADRPSRLTLVGGTHNPLAPSVDFIQHAFLPVLEQIGCEFTVEFKRYGFYPVGAGEWSISITPPKAFLPLKLEQRGQLLNATARCIGAGVPGHVMVREKERLMRRLKWTEEAISISQVDSLGSGNSVILQVAYPHITEIVESHGALGISAEKVAETAVDALRRYFDHGAPVGQYLAYQLLLPLCLGAGGSFVTGPLSKHTRTNIKVIQQLDNVQIATEEMVANKQWRVTVKKPPT